MSDARDYTTADVARIVGVSVNMVRAWADRGLLRCWRLPGRAGHRRITHAELQRFLAAHGIEHMLPAESRP